MAGGPGPVALAGSGEFLPVMEPVDAALLEGRPRRAVVRTLALPLSFLLCGLGSPGSCSSGNTGPCMTSSRARRSSTPGTRERPGSGSSRDRDASARPVLGTRHQKKLNEPSAAGDARHPASREAIWATAGLPLIVVVLIGAIGASQVSVLPAPNRVLNLALAQPSFPQTLIWDEKTAAMRMEKIMALSRLALASEPDLLIWPESGAPDMTPDNESALRQLLAQHHAWLMLCLDTEDARPDGGAAIYNSAMLLNPDGRPAGIYHKRRLVIFGEYIPFIRWLPFLKILAPIGSGFSAGNGACGTPD